MGVEGGQEGGGNLNLVGKPKQEAEKVEGRDVRNVEEAAKTVEKHAGEQDDEGLKTVEKRVGTNVNPIVEKQTNVHPVVGGE